jgi:molybdopterin-guanine dinucleotide biosynthesis protein A
MSTTSNIPTEQITLAILSNGDSRKKGESNAAVEIGGMPILKYLLDRFAWPGPTFLITSPGNEHPPGSQYFTREVVDRNIGDGPLCGLLTALEKLQTPILVATTVDMPGVRVEQLNWLVTALDARPDSLGIMLQRKTPQGELIEYFPSVYRNLAIEPVANRVARGKRSLHSLLRDKEFLTVPAPENWDQRVWSNLNNIEDMLAIMALQKSPPSVR